MLRIIFGIFVVLHGLVHLLYFGQSARYFELQPGMVWPDRSWAFSKLLSETITRTLASIFLALAAIGFVAGSAGVFARQAWWPAMAIGVAAFSTVLFVLFWDGVFQQLANKGMVAILINAAIVVVAVVWPDF